MNFTENNTNLDELLKDIKARQIKAMDEARAIIAACNSRTSAPPTEPSATAAHKININTDGTFIFDGVEYRIAINENERTITIAFHKFRYNTSEDELMEAGIAFSLNDDAVNYCIRKWLQ